MACRKKKTVKESVNDWIGDIDISDGFNEALELMNSEDYRIVLFTGKDHDKYCDMELI